MAVEEHKHQCDVHEFTMRNHEERLNKLDEILDKVRNRLPVWATMAIGALLAIIGFLVSRAGGVS